MPASPIRPRVWVNLLVGTALGLFLGIVAAAVQESLQRTTPVATMTRSPNLDVLAVVP